MVLYPIIQALESPFKHPNNVETTALLLSRLLEFFCQNDGFRNFAHRFS